MKAQPCTLHINSARGYEYTPKQFTSIRKAIKYARGFYGGFSWTVYDENGHALRHGFCDDSPVNGYRFI